MTSPAPQANPSPVDPDAERVHRLNEQARAGSVTETVAGISVTDPYRSLETESDGTNAWIDTQSSRTEETLRGWARPETRSRLTELLYIGRIFGVTVGGPRIFFSRQDGDREQPALYVHGRAEPLVDPLTYGERAALDWYYPSPDGRYVAFGISVDGDERSTLRIIEVASGNILPDTIAHAKWSRVSWLNSGRGFYYTRYPKPGEPRYDAEHEDSYWPEVFFHELGQSPDRDPAISPYGDAIHERTDFPSPYVSDDDRHVVVNVQRGWSATDVYVVDHRTHRSTPVVVGRDNISYGRMVHGKLYLLTNVEAPKYRIVTAQVTPRPAAVSAWQTVLPEGDASIEDFAIAGDRIYVHVVDDVRSRLRSFDLRGTAVADAELPTRGSIDSFDVSHDGHTVAFGFASFFYPPSLFRWDGSGTAPEQLAQVQSDVDVSRYELSQERVPSADGTLINVYYVHRRGLPRNGQNRVLLTGYGGFNVSLLPTFTRHALYWLEQGGVFAVANLRGGAEFGEGWHRAGNLMNKIRVFEDMEAVIRWFSRSQISSPSRIGITGGSNGGLLMGAMITRCPDAFAATATYVGLYDMMRYQRFPPAELWVSEYGSSDDADQARYLFSYSPYHRIVDGTAYPSVLVETADHDGRVHWAHSTKFAARLQEATQSNPVLFYMERQVGHGAGTRLSDLVEKYVRMYAFFEHALAQP